MLNAFFAMAVADMDVLGLGGSAGWEALLRAPWINNTVRHGARMHGHIRTGVIELAAACMRQLHAGSAQHIATLTPTLPCHEAAPLIVTREHMIACSIRNAAVAGHASFAGATQTAMHRDT
jgi:hypothetical protein